MEVCAWVTVLAVWRVQQQCGVAAGVAEDTLPGAPARTVCTRTSEPPALQLVTHLHPYTHPKLPSHPTPRQALGGPSYLAQHVPLSPIPMPDVKQPPSCEELCKQVRGGAGQRRPAQTRAGP